MVAAWMLTTVPAMHAQAHTAATHAAVPAIGAHVAPAKALNAVLSDFQEEFMGIVKAMPAEKYSFAPTSAMFPAAQGAKFNGVKTFANQAAHVAMVLYSVYGTASGVKPNVDVDGIARLQSKDEIVHALDGAFAFAHKAVATITPENAFEVVGEPGLQTRATLAGLAVTYGSNHKGQMVEYLRMNGIIPPGSK